MPSPPGYSVGINHDQRDFMSCYLAITLPDHIILAADNRRRIFGKIGQKPFAKPILLDDAKKLLGVCDGLWVTGVGLSQFAPMIVSELKRKVRSLSKNSPLDAYVELLPGQEELLRAYDRLLTEAVNLWETLGDSPIDPRDITTDIVFAAVTKDSQPLLMRANSASQFALETFSGTGHTLISPFGSHNSSTFESSLTNYMQDNIEQLLEANEEELIHRSLILFPPVMAHISRTFPERVSPTGDLLLVGPQRKRWMLF